MDTQTYYTVYRVTNKVNGKVYIGCHKTRNLDDGYMGSGKYIKRAIEKHGVDQFEKEILFIYDNAIDMFAKEAELVTEDFIEEQNTYNLKVGGMGGFDYVNSMRKNIYGRNGENWVKYGNPKSLERQRELRENDLDWVKRYSDRISEGLNKYYSSGGKNGFEGKFHDDETKEKIGKNSAEYQLGEGNSQYGTRWIHSLEEKRSKKIKKHDPIPDGWNEGRKMKFD